jgi:hypothetical protein
MVSVSYTQNWRLRRVDRWMSRSDPHLAAMLAIFARLNALWLLLAYVRRAIRWTAKAVARPFSGGERSWLGLGPGHISSHVDERYS